MREEFKLFDGIFGASNEVLGSIESGVGFEKRIAQIYQHCRTPEVRKHGVGSNHAIPPILNVASGNFWPIKFPVPWLVSGSLYQNIFASEHGTCCVGGQINLHPQVEPRLALQLVHEATLCVTCIRQARSLSQTCPHGNGERL